MALTSVEFVIYSNISERQTWPMEFYLPSGFYPEFFQWEGIIRPNVCVCKHTHTLLYTVTKYKDDDDQWKMLHLYIYLKISIICKE